MFILLFEVWRANETRVWGCAEETIAVAIAKVVALRPAQGNKNVNKIIF
jgi:hypothetical protein